MGHITVGRRYFACPHCTAKQVPWDRWAGMDHRSLTPGARRLATLAGTSWSFDRASSHLKAFCHLSVSDDTIEAVCQEEGRRAAQWMKASDVPVEVFAKAAGSPEISSDGVKVNTVGGWREMRLTAIVKRQACSPCAASHWDRRVLNDPTVKLMHCMIADANHVGASWKRWSRRLGLEKSTDLSVMGDGAKWIWEQAAKRLSKQSSWCVDVYHVGQHLHGCGKRMFGEGPTARDWADQRLMHALMHNGPALIRRVEKERDASAGAHRAALDSLLNYLKDNQDRMWYQDRLNKGLPIGTGLIEGGCKNTIGSRLKANSARWRVRRIEKIGTLRCLADSKLWDAFWESKAA